MEALATDRLTVPAGAAPGGLALVQELVNTASRPAAEASHIPDQLADEASGTRWLTAALRQWAEATGQPAPSPVLGKADLAPLRKLRETVRALASPAADGPTPQIPQIPQTPPVTASVALHLDPDGRIAYGTGATGWRAVTALVATEILLAQRTGQWERFKACPYAQCGIAFFDHTRNNNRVWHDVRICGNRTNLSASRQRRRDSSEAADAAGVTTPAP